MNRRHAGVLGAALASAAVFAIALRVKDARTLPPVVDSGSTEGASTADRPDSAAPALVTVFDDGTPYPDRWVVFHDADGNVVTVAQSDRAGKVSAAIPDGGMVTVAYGSSVQHLRTIVGVRPGDSVVVGEAEDEGHGSTTVVRARVRLPGPRADATRYTLSAGVAETDVPSPSEPLTLSILDRFIADGGKPTDAGPSKPRFRLLAEALAANRDPIAFTFAWGEAPLTGAGEVDVTLPAWSTRYRPFTTLLVNPPPGLSSVRGELGIVTSASNRFIRPGRAAPIGAETALRFQVPEPLGDDIALRLELAWSGSDKGVIARRQHAEALTRVNLAIELLPRVSSAMVSPSKDPARPIVRWTVADGAAPADATVVRLKWPASGEHEWTIVLPPNHRDPVRLPALPPILATWRPDSRPMVPAVAVVESSVYESYDEVRAKGIDMAADGIEDDEDGWVRWSSTGDIAF